MKCENCGNENVEIITKEIGYSCGRCGRNTERMKELEPKTNADRIRSMSDEELAELLNATVREQGDNLFLCKDYEDDPLCTERYCPYECGIYLKWLQSEVEG